MTLIDPPVTRKPPLDKTALTRASQAWFARATSVLAGGISSSARSTTTVGRPHPQYMVRGDGPRIWDADGNEFVDHLLSYGSIPLGHADAGLTLALTEQLTRGTMFGTCNTVEVELAEQICRMVPCAELVRYANSGSEAISGAVRAARGFTGRDKILKFEGHYHGWVDVLAVSNRPTPAEAGSADAPASVPHSRGIPAGVYSDVVICPWNEPATLRAILDAHAGELAAVVAEPIVANNACLMPQPGYLELLRDECSRRGILLIFDEIVTGFRAAAGGAQELFGVEPDLAVYSKALGGGLPISAFAGRRAVMDLVGQNQVKHGGTYNGNPLCAAAALYTLRRLAEPGAIAGIHEHGLGLMEAIRRSARDAGVACVVQGLGAMFQVVFGLEAAPRNYRELGAADQAQYGAFRDALLRLGVHANSSGLACWFTSAAHGPDEQAFVVDAIGRAMRVVA
jgi:glutamate-1-semialdehyde 2,1-aminomutase